MANRKLVSKQLNVDRFNDKEIELLLAWISRTGSGGRWVFANLDSGPVGVPPDEGDMEAVEDPRQLCRDRGAIGVVFPDQTAAEFFDRFSDASDAAALLRVAGKVAPLLPDLHPNVYGIDYAMRPGAKVQRLINLFGRFLPKEKAIAVQSEIDGQPLGLYVGFSRRREVVSVIGLSGWPEDIVRGGPLAGLSVLGYPVEIGIRITSDAFVSLLEDRLNRIGYRKLFKAGDIVIDPLPLAPKLALKAARII